MSSPDKGKRTIEQPRRTEQAAPRVEHSRTVERRPSQRQEVEDASSALEYFERDLNTVTEQLRPFVDGTRDPHSHIDELKESYEKLYPLDEFLSYYLHDHRDEISDETKKAIQKIQAHTSGLNFVLLAEGPEHPDMLVNFISHTLDSVAEIKPVLHELDTP